MAQAIVEPRRADLSPKVLANLSTRQKTIGNRVFFNANMESRPVSEIRAFVDKLAYWQSQYPTIAYGAGDPEPKSFSWGNAQNVTTLLMSKAMRIPPVKWPFMNLTANRYCSGSTANEVAAEIARIRRDYSRATGIANFSGEHTEILSGVQKNMYNYVLTISKLAGGTRLHFKDPTVSMKPSQFGTYMGEAELREIFPGIFEKEGDEALWIARFLFAFNNIQYLVNYAKQKNVDVWIDMEDHRLTTFTAHVLYPALLDEDRNVGVVFQGNLKRTKTDLELLFALMPEVVHSFRSCKGVYFDNSFNVYVPMDERTRTFIELNEFLATAPNKYDVALLLASGSMDLKAQKAALKAYLENESPNLEFRMQVLKGCYTDEFMWFVKSEGIPLDHYLIFGNEIFAYTFRRLRKNPIVQEMMKEGLSGIGTKAALIIPKLLYARFYEGGSNNERLPGLL